MTVSTERDKRTLYVGLDIGGTKLLEARTSFTGSVKLVNNNDNTAGTGFNNVAGAFQMNGNSITLNGNVINASANTQTINLHLIVNNNQTFYNAAEAAVHWVFGGLFMSLPYDNRPVDVPHVSKGAITTVGATLCEKIA